MVQDGVRHAILWTTVHPFYEKLGWWMNDLSCLTLVSGNCRIESKDPLEIDVARVRRAEAIRNEWASNALPRSYETWCTVPPHADEVELIIEDGGYALVGKRSDTGYLYEMCGPQGSWPSLWQRVRTRYRQIVANGKSGSAWVRWMSTDNHAVWRPNSLGMHFTPNCGIESSGFYMPFFSVIDRI